MFYIIIFKSCIHNVVSRGTNSVKIWISLCLMGCVRFPWYCGKMYSRHLFFSYEGFFANHFTFCDLRSCTLLSSSLICRCNWLSCDLFLSTLLLRVSLTVKSQSKKMKKLMRERVDFTTKTNLV